MSQAPVLFLGIALNDLVPAHLCEAAGGFERRGAEFIKEWQGREKQLWRTLLLPTYIACTKGNPLPASQLLGILTAITWTSSSKCVPKRNENWCSDNTFVHQFSQQKYLQKAVHQRLNGSTKCGIFIH